MFTELDISKWSRKNHFHFFKTFDNPFFNICSNIEVTELLNHAQKKEISFFLASLFLSIKAANEVEEFRYRIKDDKVLIFNKIHPFSTILNSLNNFNFCKFDYASNFTKFNSLGKKSIKKTLENPDLIGDNIKRLDVIHYSTIPWISLTSVSHARKFNTTDSIPKIVFGKYFEQNNAIMLPISVEVHHSLVDGYHVGKFLDTLRNYIINSKEILSQ